jgi:tRNA modification GTPase
LIVKRGIKLLTDTIVALATAPMESAIGLIRISGKKAFSIIGQIFNKKINTTLAKNISFGKIIDGDKVIDEVLVLSFKSPNSFTGEDVVEITVHGSLIVINKVIQLIIKNGARMAERGEFSKRAYFNGKIDLVQAESINDLITSRSEEAANLALNGLEGKLSSNVNQLKEKLLALLAHIEVNIDYPEYEDIEQITTEKLLPLISSLIKSMKELLNDAKVGTLIKSGVNTAIIGRPNVGKSSILNSLIKEDKAIVSEIAGTTRDVVEGRAYFEGITFNFLDTAGIRDSEDKIETIGIKKTKEMIEKADLVIMVTDTEEITDPEDLKLIKLISNKKNIVAYNKADLRKSKLDSKVRISAKNNQIDKLIKAMIDAIGFDIKEYENKPLLSNARQIGLIAKALNSLEEAHKAALIFQPTDLVEVDIKLALEAVLELRGDMAKDNLSEEIFARFCLGK